MIKKYFLLFFIVFEISAFAQSYNAEVNGKTLIINVDNLKAEEIQSKILAWVALNYKSANDVIQHSSQDKIIAKGNFVINSNKPFTDLFNGVVHLPTQIIFDHTLIVSIKDYKCKVDISFPEKVKTLNYLNTDWFFNINEYTLLNEFTIENQYEIAKKNLNAQNNNNEKKVNRKFESLKKYLDANFVHEKEVSTGMNNKTNAIFSSLDDYLKKKNQEW